MGGFSVAMSTQTLGGHVAGIEDVLDGDRHAVQGADGFSRFQGGVGITGFGQRQLRIHVYPCRDQGISGFNAIEARFHKGGRGRIPTGNRGCCGPGR